ncbi:hypothetical protein IWQ61_003675 [Dispira simplex]|nr:hypothetical protein IWQ61_003675 [Dispira simplex]
MVATRSSGRNTTFPDYYDLLNVAPTATAEEIRKAYMREALQNHPDRSNDPHATQKFQQVADAYFVLSDRQRRAEYDHARNSQPRQQDWQRRHAQTTDEEEAERANTMFGNVFEELLRPEVENPKSFWSPLGYISGGILGFIVANLPGAFVGAFAGGKLGAIRDNKGKSVYEVFCNLERSHKYAILQALLVQILTGHYGK